MASNNGGLNAPLSLSGVSKEMYGDYKSNRREFKWLLDYDALYTQYQLSIEQKFRKLFVNRFSFINCPEFSKRNQTLFFNVLFSFGRVAVKRIDGDLYVFLPFNFRYFLDGSVREATLYPAAQYYSQYGWNYDGKNKKNNKSFSVNSFDSNIEYDPNDTVIIDKKYYYLSDRENTEIYSSSLARFYIILENMSMHQRQLLVIFESGNEPEIEKAFKDISKSIIKLNNLFNQDGDLSKINTITQPKTAKSYFETIDLSGNIKNIMDLIDRYQNFAYKNLGLPSQMMFKKERLITDEVENSNSDVALETKADEQQLAIFIDEFNEIFGANMELVINISSGSGNGNDGTEDKNNENGEILNNE